MPRRRTIVIIVTLAPVGCMLVLAVALFLIGLVWGRCYDLRSETVASPGGVYVAHYKSKGCGGATGVVRLAVDLRSETDGRSVRVLYSQEPPRQPLEGLKLKWTDDRTLLVQYQYEESSVSLIRTIDLGSRAWRDVMITYQEISLSDRCSIYHPESVISPDGKYHALYELEVCDPAMGDPQRIWYDRGVSEAVIDKPDSPHDIAVVLAGGPSGYVYLITSSDLPDELKLKWADNRTLIVEYQGWDELRRTMDRRQHSYGDVRIIYRELPLPPLPG